MRISLQKLAGLTLLSILYAALTACTTPTPLLTPTLTPLAFLTPFISSTPSQKAPTPTALTTIPVTPSSTPTPFLHVLTNDDTLLGLALRYGVSLQEILAANPGINPHFLTVGKTVVIPINISDEPTALPSPTLVPLQLSTPDCYPAGDGGAWCVVLLQNGQAQAVENVTVWLGLYSTKGINIASQVLVPPLNLIDKGKAVPLMAFFAPPFDPGVTARAKVLSALPVEKKLKRYLPVSVQVTEVNIAPPGEQAEVRGQIALSGTVKASALWVVAVAYGNNGEIAGMRKWEAESDPNCLSPLSSDTPAPGATPKASLTPAAARRLPRSCQTFDVTVFSLGPVIGKVEVLAEARP